MFADGWAFFLPYLAAYGLGWAMDVTNERLRWCFWALHIATATLAARFSLAQLAPRDGRPRWWLIRQPGTWFWIALALVFLVPGAYLEFPADPWEHLRRLNEPSAQERLRENEFALRFAYFWGWTLLSPVSVETQRRLLDLYSAFWQMLLAYQFFRFARGLGIPAGWARLQVVAVLALFGNNIFSLFRYYALSSTPLAFIAYLAAARALLDAVAGSTSRTRSAATIAGCLIVASLNHPQAVLFFCLFASVTATHHLVSRMTYRSRAMLGVGLLLVWAVSLAIGWRVLRDPDSVGLRPARLAAPWVSQYGVYAIWDRGLSPFQTLGVAGFVTLGLAGALVRRSPLSSVLTVTPPALLVFPPFVFGFSRFAYPEAAWRLLLMMPWPFLFVEVFRVGPFQLPRFGGPPPEKLRLLACLGALMALGSVSRAPFFGKLDFQLYRAPPELEMRALDQTAQWFGENRSAPRQCVIKSDSITESVLSAFTGRPLTVHRTSGHFVLRKPDWVAKAPHDLREFQELSWSGKPVDVCGFLVFDPEALSRLAPVRPWVGSVLARHWPLDAPEFTSRVPPRFFEEAEALLKHGWRKTFVPPHYWYYEPPPERRPLAERGAHRP